MNDTRRYAGEVSKLQSASEALEIFSNQIWWAVKISDRARQYTTYWYLTWIQPLGNGSIGGGTNISSRLCDAAVNKEKASRVFRWRIKKSNSHLTYRTVFGYSWWNDAGLLDWTTRFWIDWITSVAFTARCVDRLLCASTRQADDSFDRIFHTFIRLPKRPPISRSVFVLFFHTYTLFRYPYWWGQNRDHLRKQCPSVFVKRMPWTRTVRTITKQQTLCLKQALSCHQTSLNWRMSS